MCVCLDGDVPLVPALAPDLIKVAKEQFGDVESGGMWKPQCQTDHSLAIIIPYRDTYGDRNINLQHLIAHLHTILRKQLVDYVIIVVQQVRHNTCLNIYTHINFVSYYSFFFFLNLF